MAYQHYRSPFGDTTFTKVFVGGLAWETPNDVMQSYFEQFGEILEAVIITDKNTGKSKGYGFVTFRDAESARRASANPNPVIDGRRANCNIASLGRPRPSPPRGRSQGGSPYHGAPPQVASPSSYGVGTPLAPPSPVPPPPPTVIYPPYGYATYPPDYGYYQSVYNPLLQQPQYYHQSAGGGPYGVGSSASPMGSPYYYGYSMQATRGTFSGTPQAQRIPHQPYLYYPTHMDASFSSYPPPPPTLLQSTSIPFSPPPSDPQTPQHTSTENEAGPATSESPNT